MTSTHMTSTDTDLEITRENAFDVLLALELEELQLLEQLEATTDPAGCAEMYQRGATNAERQALAWERRPGRTRDKQPQADRYRWTARMCTVAAEIEQLRCHAATQGCALPDPRVLLAEIHDEAAIEALIALYTAAGQPPSTNPEAQRPV